MKRLIFLHIGKSGGTSVLGWLNMGQGVKVYNYNHDSSLAGSDCVRTAAADADVVHIHGAGKGFKSNFDESNWLDFIQDSIRLCVVRDPIAKFESDFRYALEQVSPHQIPYVATYGFAENGGFGQSDYCSQSSDKRIDINEWVDFAFSCHLSSFGLMGFGRVEDELNILQNHDAASRFSSGQGSDYFDIKNELSVDSKMKWWMRSVFESQFMEITRHFGAEFLLFPRVDPSFDILMTTELLDMSFARCIAQHDFFKKFTVYAHAPTGVSVFWDLVNSLKSSRRNMTSREFLEPSKLSPPSRFKFFALSRNSHLLWRSASEVNASRLQSFLQ